MPETAFPPATDDCGVCWGSHMCGLPMRHDGNHLCSPDDEDGGCESVPRSGLAGSFQWTFYQLDLLRYDGDFCDLCGPVERAPHINAVLDHAMRAHPDIWAAEYASHYADYLGDGKWRDRVPRPLADV